MRGTAAAVCLAVSFALPGCGAAPSAAAPWHELFDGRSLDGFVPTPFGGEGPVTVQGGAIELAMGSPLSGVTLTAPPPHGEYELEVVAARLLGNDFFCAVTFPVGDSHLTLVLGGWGGTVCGFSSLDGMDAANNDTRTLRHFESDRDHRVRITVTADAVRSWIDGEPFVSTPRAGVRFGLRNEMLPCVPFGISSFATTARIRAVRWRPLPAR